jgi:glyoxylase-like metal-dependent hydrolase (beta-lactamase superfamily II)
MVHRLGQLLFDTGMHPNVMSEPVEYLGPLAKRLAIPVYVRGQDIMSRLEAIGFSLKDVTYIAISHLHHDHAGCIRFFENAVVFVQETEYVYATTRGSKNTGYVRSEFEGNVKFKCVRGLYDIFGDGRAVLFQTPGHTLGHQSLYVQLDSMKIILTGDCCYLKRNVEEISAPGPCIDGEAGRNSVRSLRKWRDNTGGCVLVGHDLEQWKEVKKAPEYYV